ncbi:MAG: hypothetical protein WCQ41_01060 [Bacillota bacterium]
MSNEYADMASKAKEMRDALEWQINRSANIKQKLNDHVDAGYAAGEKAVSDTHKLGGVSQVAKLMGSKSTGEPGAPLVTADEVVEKFVSKRKANL